MEFKNFKKYINKLFLPKLLKILNANLTQKEFEEKLTPYIDCGFNKNNKRDLKKYLNELFVITIKYEEKEKPLTEQEKCFYSFFDKCIFLIKNNSLDSFYLLEKLFLLEVPKISYFTAILNSDVNQINCLKQLTTEKIDDFQLIFNSKIKYSDEQTQKILDYLMNFHHEVIENSKIKELMLTDVKKNGINLTQNLFKSAIKEKNVAFLKFVDSQNQEKLLKEYLNLYGKIDMPYFQLGDEEKFKIISFYLTEDLGVSSKNFFLLLCQDLSKDLAEKINNLFEEKKTDENGKYRLKNNKIDGKNALQDNYLRNKDNSPVFYEVFKPIKEQLDLEKINISQRKINAKVL